MLKKSKPFKEQLPLFNLSKSKYLIISLRMIQVSQAAETSKCSISIFFFHRNYNTSLSLSRSFYHSSHIVFTFLYEAWRPRMTIFYISTWDLKSRIKRSGTCYIRLLDTVRLCTEKKRRSLKQQRPIAEGPSCTLWHTLAYIHPDMKHSAFQLSYPLCTFIL